MGTILNCTSSFHKQLPKRFPSEPHHRKEVRSRIWRRDPPPETAW